MNIEDWWYKFYLFRYRRDTRHLTMEQHGIYRGLIDAYMETQRGFKDDFVELAKAAGCPLDVLERNWPVLRSYFVLSNGILTLKRCEFIISGTKAKSHIKAAAGSAGGRAKAARRAARSGQDDVAGSSRNAKDDVANHSTMPSKGHDNIDNSSTCQKDDLQEEKRREENHEKREEGILTDTEAEMYFQRVWAIYPGYGPDGARGASWKGNLKPARASFFKVLKKEKDYEQFTRSVIEAIYLYTDYLDNHGLRSCYFSTWINQERWKDDYSSTEPERRSTYAEAIAEGIGRALQKDG